MSKGTQTSVNARDILEIILEKADDPAISALIANPGLQFLYPYRGLQWVVYLGGGLARCVLDSKGKISFDPNKIEGIRWVDPSVDEVADKADEKIRKRVRRMESEEVSRVLAVGNEKEPNKKPLAKGLI